jgi:predicted DNA-binding transcriptional regulator AlpA
MSSTLDTLPAGLARHRILDTRETCKFVGISIAQWRRLRSGGEAPSPVMIGIRKHGWKVGDLIAWIDSRASDQKSAA